ncbi:hypothetical protein H0H81_003990 [Sphagnurus paluster]|uniref:Uncharacterized protein n=1 Tax=Sphagnurus paluster TaxID=117069 RepID=A0A9P7FSP1_9AGAR|nr:hypothetical protein H0H81_003990 [Sphagnurus paluster]
MTDTGMFFNWDPQHILFDEATEDAFYASVSDQPRFASLANEVNVILVDLDEPQDEPESSNVVSVDFMLEPESADIN